MPASLRRGLRALQATVFVACIGCVVQRGSGFSSEQPPAAAQPEQGVSLVLLGDAGGPTRTASKVAQRLRTVLEGERASGRTTVVLWAGDNVLPKGLLADCPESGDPWQREGSAALADVVRAHIAAGQPSFAVAGEVEHRCDLLSSQRREQPETHPFVMPAPQYTVGVGLQGETAVTRTCTNEGCRLHPGPDPTVIELVMVDTVPWVQPDPAAGEPILRALDHLLADLEQTAGRSPPRILVTHLPVEAAGVHGMGGHDADATIHTLYPPLRRAVVAGAFDGVLAAHDRASYVHPDLTQAIKRSDRVWLKQPLWQVVSGAASRPVGSSARILPRTRYYTSDAYVPLSYTPSAGFAVVRIDGNELQATLHARRLRWQHSTVSMPVASPPHRTETASPNMEPCLRCPDIPAHAR